jgi:hypothetical protein
MAAEYRGFDFGRKADIAWIDRRKRLKNHDVVFKPREPLETPCSARRGPPEHAAVPFSGAGTTTAAGNRRSRQRRGRELSNANALTVAFRAFLSGPDLWLRERRRRKPNALQTEL